MRLKRRPHSAKYLSIKLKIIKNTNFETKFVLVRIYRSLDYKYQFKKPDGNFLLEVRLEKYTENYLGYSYILNRCP